MCLEPRKGWGTMGLLKPNKDDYHENKTNKF